MGALTKYSAEGVHEKVLEILSLLKRGFVLDVPSGQGAISKELEGYGFKVFSGDIESKNMLYRNGRCAQLDLNDFLPFKNRSFDYVVCVEGIEHLYNSHGVIREFARVIKKGGYLIMTTPNVMTIKSRVRFLLYSYLDFFKYFGPIPMDEKHMIHEYDHQHIHPIFYGAMKFFLEKNGFQVRRIETNKKVKKWKMIYPLLKKIIKHKTGKKFRRDPFLVSDALLEGEILIYLAQYGKEVLID